MLCASDYLNNHLPRCDRLQRVLLHHHLQRALICHRLSRLLPHYRFSTRNYVLSVSYAGTVALLATILGSSHMAIIYT
ncbi:MAG: hypothetical protein AAF316_16385 [Cyanobacteria bacterium P01_A01_bin.80]